MILLVALFLGAIILGVQTLIYTYFGFWWYALAVLFVNLGGFGIMADEKEKAIKGKLIGFSMV